MKNFLTILSIIFVNNLTAEDLGIKKYDTLKVEKGYILSIDLQDKKCKNIYLNQIPHFLKKNKHIKDPNIIVIGDTLIVQDCTSPSRKIRYSHFHKEDKNHFFIGINTGYSSSSSKNGYNMGLKLGYLMESSRLYSSIAIGANRNVSKTKGSPPTGIYEINTDSLDLVISIGKSFSNHKLGLNSRILYGEDLSYEYINLKESFAQQIGLEYIYRVNNKFNIESSLEKRLDKNIKFLNLGVRYAF